jgi:hypothetical protein
MPSTFGKREREQAKRAKAEAKRQRRQQRVSTDDNPSNEGDDEVGASDHTRISGDDVLAMIAELHQRYEAGTISFEDFEASKADLLARLVVD